MNLSVLLNKAVKTLKSNSPEILTALGVSGVVTTSYLVAKASFKAARHLDGVHVPLTPELTPKEKTKEVWKFYIPPAISGAMTIGCIIGAAKTNGNRTAAAVTAYSLTERAFSEYRDKVVEQVGKGKEQTIRDEIAQDRVTKKPVGDKEVVILGSGHVLCCELFTHRYFRSDMETLRKARNDLNALMMQGVYATLDDFYEMIGLPGTSDSNHIGWDNDRGQMELHFTTALSESNEPCLAFTYNYTKPLR